MPEQCISNSLSTISSINKSNISNSFTLDVLKMATKKQFPLRLDPKLYAALERWAADEFRSTNAHIEFLLRDAVRRAGRLQEHPTPEDSENHKKI